MFYDRFTESVRQWPDLIAVELQRESSAVAAGAAAGRELHIHATSRHGRVRRQLAGAIQHHQGFQVRLPRRQPSLVDGRLSRRPRLRQHRRAPRHRLPRRPGPQAAPRFRRRSAFHRPPAPRRRPRSGQRSPDQAHSHRRRAFRRRPAEPRRRSSLPDPPTSIPLPSHQTTSP